MRVATWNVERPGARSYTKVPGQRRRIAEVDADVWVLTETRRNYQPTIDHRHGVCSPPHPGRRPEDECWTAIWSRWPLRHLDDPPAHRRGTVAAIVESPSGDFIVYGTVIAWANEPFFDDGSPARMWQVHAAEIERQGTEWVRLRAQHPDLPLIVAGDFNQNRDGARWYGTHGVRDSLTQQLRRAGLRCLTDIDVVAAGMLGGHHLVDHICASPDLELVGDLQCWEPREAGTSVRLSDHPTVLVTLRNGSRTSDSVDG